MITQGQMMGQFVPNHGTIRSVGTGTLSVMGSLLTKRRAVDFCRVGSCLCRPV